MKPKIIRSLPFRRKIEGRTDYRKRIGLLRSNQMRLVVRKSLNDIYMSLIDYSEKGDKALLSVSTKSLEKFGWKTGKGNVPSAYLVGLMFGKTAQGKGIKRAILDMGLNKSVKGSRIYAALAGALDSGMDIPHSKDILPPKERINGTHISKFAEELKKDRPRYERQFSIYLKNNIDPSNLHKYFDDVKNKIMKG
ncbi:50S ribosomal protein L18 [Candidatus Woesearchaeota archaeon]|nr:50S ribosomal protein L18 [Candidatus Woesearchaeota archaeon]MBI2130935.1 50S ribosomal protein L18 [Candidatus Woesearchaeota archaeon]MBI2661352.1 50S ribosomal protein L18 [Candidatus Woesearchaeota archaeon]